MNLNVVFDSVSKILSCTALFVIPYLISKWFVMKDYKPEPVLYKITSNWDYLKGTVVSIVIGSMIFLGGSSSDKYEPENTSRFTHEDAVAFFIVMCIGGLIGIFVSHFQIRKLNEKVYKKKQAKNLELEKFKETRIGCYYEGYQAAIEYMGVKNDIINNEENEDA
ncbi:MAG: hypothetical protein ABIU55_03775 [Ferruginibacter sp.]